jgi:TonB family protein
MKKSWRHFEGHVVGGKFPLSQYLGGSEHSAVFLTERAPGEPRRAIKLVAADGEKAARRLSRWADAEKLSHRYLLRLFEMGRSRLGGEEMLYLVMEYAEEDLSQVVTTRALTPRECQEMLPAVLEGLAYIHRRGFVHGHLKPANIMAMQEQVKISCDGLCRAGEVSSVLGKPSVYDPPETAKEGLSAAGDVWSLGITLVEVLTQKVPVLGAGRADLVLPPSMPTALADVVRHCVLLDPRQRWTIGEIVARLARAPRLAAKPQAEAGLKPAPGRKNYLLPGIGLAIVLAAVIAATVFRSPRKSAAPAPPQVSDQASVASQKPAPVETPAPPVAKPAARSLARNAVVREVLPKVPQSARDTIRGTVRVGIRVALDETGNVAEARFDSLGPSKYFARVAMQAAQGWKFAPPQADGPNKAKEWLLRFEFRRDSTHVIPTPRSR